MLILCIIASVIDIVMSDIIPDVIVIMVTVMLAIATKVYIIDNSICSGREKNVLKDVLMIGGVFVMTRLKVIIPFLNKTERSSDVMKCIDKMKVCEVEVKNVLYVMLVIMAVCILVYTIIWMNMLIKKIKYDKMNRMINKKCKMKNVNVMVKV
ncbi:hypothetical protein OCOL_000729 [Ordospora colligata]|uniref:Uncharacterized protein n=1 Tax=Ordospora colligata OC4 TaxID=1354746 RepID=A0A0B2UKC5_9MICR|nr:uncharacterized protein M896_070710 [Ordospora colligata OC4]KHN69502.1 hypothetical protein M896_070710 [Ordospora colligata OC4]